MNEKVTKEELLKKVAELEAHIKELEKDLIHDELTGLKTRAFFEEEVKIFLDALQDNHGPQRRDWFGFKNLSILFCDIDYFKKINDTFGHSVGDFVLKAVAHTIQDALREGDIAARWGGEEMVIALLGANEDDALKKAEEIRKKISSLAFPEISALSLSLSIGVASVEPPLHFAELIDRSDKAMYRAKETGRNRVIAYSELSKST